MGSWILITSFCSNFLHICTYFRFSCQVKSLLEVLGGSDLVDGCGTTAERLPSHFENAWASLPERRKPPCHHHCHYCLTKLSSLSVLPCQNVIISSTHGVESLRAILATCSQLFAPAVQCSSRLCVIFTPGRSRVP